MADEIDKIADKHKGFREGGIVSLTMGAAAVPFNTVNTIIEVDNTDIIKKYKAVLEELPSGDPEADHIEADNILCELLREIGLGEVAAAFEAIRKWHS